MTLARGNAQLCTKCFCTPFMHGCPTTQPIPAACVPRQVSRFSAPGSAPQRRRPAPSPDTGSGIGARAERVQWGAASVTLLGPVLKGHEELSLMDEPNLRVLGFRPLVWQHLSMCAVFPAGSCFITPCCSVVFRTAVASPFLMPPKQHWPEPPKSTRPRALT